MIFVLWAMSSMLGNAEITFSNWQISSQGRYQQRGYFTLKASLSFAFELQCRALIMRCSSWALIDLSIKYVMHWCTNLLPSYECRVSVFSTGSSFLCYVAFSSFSTAYWSIWFLGSKGGAMLRALAFHNVAPGSNRRHMWLEFAVGSLLCTERFFSGYSGFLLSSKTNTSKFQFDLEHTDTFKRVHINSYVLRG